MVIYDAYQEKTPVDSSRLNRVALIFLLNLKNYFGLGARAPVPPMDPPLVEVYRLRFSQNWYPPPFCYRGEHEAV